MSTNLTSTSSHPTTTATTVAAAETVAAVDSVETSTQAAGKQDSSYGDIQENKSKVGTTSTPPRNKKSKDDNYPYSSLSPTVQVPLSYIIERTVSSPCILDASPKVNHDSTSTLSPTSTMFPQKNNVQALYRTSQLTPVTRNTSTASKQDTTIITQATYDLHLSIPNTVNNNNSRPASVPPPSDQGILTHSNNHKTTEDKSHFHSIIRPRGENPVIKTSTSEDDDANRPISPPCLQTQHSSNYDYRHNEMYHSPNSMIESPEPRSPDEKMDQQPSSLFMPYQPSRKSSLASFGLVPDDLDEIFLPSKRATNKFRRSHKDKVAHVASGGGITISNTNNINNDKVIRKTNSSIDEDEELDDDLLTSFSFSDSQSDLTSIPSIRLGARVYSSTQDSMTTLEGVEDEEDDDSILFNSGLTFQAASSSRNESNTKKKRCMSSSKEKQVYDWLRNLELEKDNNEYIAEAASSKFLIGRMSHNNNDVVNRPTESKVLPLKQMNSMTNNEKNTTNNNDGIKSSTNKIVMGRNVSLYDGSKNRVQTQNRKSKGISLSGLYR